jgi:hypothetical protein
LHDDELSCVLPFLVLADLAQLVRCSRRLRHVARKEHSRGLEIDPAVSDIPFLARSSLRHHVMALDLYQHGASDAHVTVQTLLGLRSLPQLTKLDVRVQSDGGVAVLLQGLPPKAVTKKLCRVLPTSLRSCSFTTRLVERPMQVVSTTTLAAAFLAAATNMSQLTELSIDHDASWDGMRLDALVVLPLLRKLTITGRWMSGTPLSELKALSQLRQLTVRNVHPGDVVQMCQPPHSLQLETLNGVNLQLGVSMRALTHLPTLTELDPLSFFPADFPLLPELPRIRKLAIRWTAALTVAEAASLSDALSRCPALLDLTLCVEFGQANGAWPTPEEEQRARWTALLRSVPHLCRLSVESTSFAALVAVLPDHLPQLEQLAVLLWHLRSVARAAGSPHAAAGGADRQSCADRGRSAGAGAQSTPAAAQPLHRQILAVPFNLSGVQPSSRQLVVVALDETHLNSTAFEHAIEPSSPGEPAPLQACVPPSLWACFRLLRLPVLPCCSPRPPWLSGTRRRDRPRAAAPATRTHTKRAHRGQRNLNTITVVPLAPFVCAAASRRLSAPPGRFVQHRCRCAASVFLEGS